jgi:RNA polymerase sigma-70 factor (ECF subfamily)
MPIVNYQFSIGNFPVIFASFLPRPGCPARGDAVNCPLNHFVTCNGLFLLYQMYDTTSGFPDTPSDEQLIALAQQGDMAAFGTLYERHLDVVFRYLYNRVANRHEAEDLTEQVFLRAWDALPDYTVRTTPFIAWLYRIARNLAVDHHRSPQSRLTDPEDIATHATIPDELPAVEHQVERLESDLTISAAMSRLEPIQQDVLTLRFWMGYSHRETAEALGRTEGAVRVIQHRALHLLKLLIRER